MSDPIDVTFEVPLVPKGKQRAKSRALMKAGAPVMKNGRPVVVTNKAKGTAQWQAKLAALARPHMPKQRIDEPLRVDVLFLMERPKYLMRPSSPEGLVWHGKKPDRDNLDKAVLDALKPYWTDDTLVVCGTLLKAYHAKEGRPGLVVRVRSASLFDPETEAQALGLFPSPGASGAPPQARGARRDRKGA